MTICLAIAVLNHQALRGDDYLTLLSSSSSSLRNPNGLQVLAQRFYPPREMPNIENKLFAYNQFKKAWEEWAAPNFGSFRYQGAFPGGGVTDFPVLDLQDFYRGKKPLWDSGKNGYPKPQAFQNNSVSQKRRSLIVTRKGNKFHASQVSANQDRAMTITINDQIWWMGLFDGHGDLGHIIAHFAAIQISEHVMDEVPKLLTSVHHLETVVPPMMERIAKKVHNESPNLHGAGTTAISILNFQDHLFISNIGDSQAFVVQYDPSAKQVEIIYQTKPHKPDDPEEQARIQAAGGIVIPKPPFPGASSRILIPQMNPVSGFPEEMALAMSRSIGDSEGDVVGKSCLPTTDHLRLADIVKKGYDYYVVAASDGLIDKVSIHEVALHMAKSWSARPLEAAEELILKSSKGWLDEIMGGACFWTWDLAVEWLAYSVVTYLHMYCFSHNHISGFFLCN